MQARASPKPRLWSGLFKSVWRCATCMTITGSIATLNLTTYFSLVVAESSRCTHSFMPVCSLLLPHTSIGVVLLLRAQLGDFGVTKLLENTAAFAKTTIGTPYYISPEICNEQPYSYASDVWALGVMMYELCALTVPFNAKDFPSLRRVILETKPASLSRCVCNDDWIVCHFTELMIVDCAANMMWS